MSTRNLTTGRVLVKSHHKTPGDLLHRSERDEFVTLWSHYVTEYVDPSDDESYPLHAYAGANGNNNAPGPRPSVKIRLDSSGLSMLCHLDDLTTESVRKQPLVTDLFLRANERLFVSCNELFVGKLMVTGCVTENSRRE